ncbi:hypothetical protein B0H19DRAFT_672308 [Mycena capillaripes]|nr:hypothetical protein B0H19DRAFT_672308 [Mycena capillaripes]
MVCRRGRTAPWIYGVCPIRKSRVKLQRLASELPSLMLPHYTVRDKPYSDAAVADAESPINFEVESSLRSDRKVEGPSRLQWVVILSVCIVGGWFLANALYKPKEVITVKLDKDTTDALGALLHPANNTTHHWQGTSDLAVSRGTSELAVRGLGGSELAELDKRALNPFATFSSGNAASKVGLIVGGVVNFNTGVSNCEKGG